MIRIIEVGPRDGLQNERRLVPTASKVALIDTLSASGVHEIEVSSFVSPTSIPQLSDAEDVLARIQRKKGVVYSALVPNMQGFERALSVKPDKVAVFTAASDTFTRKNVNATIDQTFARFLPVVEAARRHGMQVRGYISTVFWCPYEGVMKVEKVLALAQRLFDLGVTEVSLGDTVGKASPEDVLALLEEILAKIDPTKIAMHFHDTYGRAVENVLTAYRSGIERFDTSVGGLGGCPFAPGAAGNVATATVVHALREAGAEIDVDLKTLTLANDIVRKMTGR